MDNAPSDYNLASGLYLINPDNSDQFSVFCSMVENGKGWAVIQRRLSAEQNFNKSWQEYRNGFGELSSGSFWLGLEKIKRLADSATCQLYIGVSGSCGTKFAIYNSFHISSEAGRYRINIGDFDPSSTLNDAFSHHNGARFSTRGRETDGTYACREEYASGWWFNDCNDSKVNLNGAFGSSTQKSKTYSRLTSELVWEDNAIVVDSASGCRDIQKVVMAVRPIVY